MKNTFLKGIGCSLAILLAVSACSTGASSGGQPSDPSQASSAAEGNINPKGVFPIVKEPITLKIGMVVDPKVEDIDTNYATRFLEETTGIDLVFEALPKADTMTKVNLMFTTGTDIDVFTGFIFPHNAVEEYASAGKIVALDEYIEKYGVGYQEAIERSGDPALYDKLTTFSDGKKYTLDYINSAPSGSYSGLAWLYEPWLKKLDAQMPQTLEEYHQLLLRFKNEDPNGNGKHDEMPLSGASDTLGFLVAFFGNAFQDTNTSNWVKVKDGKVSFIGDNEEYKQTLQYLNKLCQEGLLDPLAFTQGRTELTATMAQPELTVGAFAYPSISAYMDTTGERCRNFITMKPLKGPDGFVSTQAIGLKVNHAYLITSTCKNPEAAYRLGDFIQSEEGNNTFRYGEKGVDWDDPDPNGVDFKGDPAYIKIINDVWGLASNKVIWATNNVPYVLDINYERRQSDGDAYSYETKKSVGSYFGCMPVAPKEFVPSSLPFETIEDSTRVAELKQAIDDYMLESYVQFIVGDRPFDRWDQYVAELGNLNVDEYVALTQKAYDATYKK